MKSQVRARGAIGAALIAIPAVTLAHGGVSGAIGAVQTLLSLAIIAVGFVPLLFLGWWLFTDRSMRLVPGILASLVAAAYLLVAIYLLYAFGKNPAVLGVFIQACATACLLILILAKRRVWRAVTLIALVCLIGGLNLARPRLVDFYSRVHVDNSPDYSLQEFQRDAYWRAMTLEDGRQLLITSHPPAELRAAKYSDLELERLSRQFRSPLGLVEQEGKPGVFDILALDRSEESYIATDEAYFSLPILGQKIVNRYRPRALGEAMLLSGRIEPAAEYLMEILTIRWGDRAGGEEKIKPRAAYWAERMMRQDLDPNYAAPGHATSLLQAAVDFQHLSAAVALIDKGADLEHVNQRGWTALHYAARWHSSLVDLLLKHGANPVAETRSGDTPLELVQRRLRGEKSKINGEWIVDTESERYQDGLKIIEMLEARIRAGQ